MRKQKTVLVLAGFLVLTLSACNNNSRTFLSNTDSVAIYEAMSKKMVAEHHFFSMPVTRPITETEAMEMIGNYQDPKNRIKELIAYDSADTNIPKIPYQINAFSFGTAVIDYAIEHKDTIRGLRVYLAKHKQGKPEKQTYALVIIPTNKNGDNVILKDKAGTGIFEWNDPCPPYCKPSVRDYGH